MWPERARQRRRKHFANLRMWLLEGCCGSHGKSVPFQEQLLRLSQLSEVGMLVGLVAAVALTMTILDFVSSVCLPARGAFTFRFSSRNALLKIKI